MVGMPTPPINDFKGYRFPREIISHAVWLYYHFSLSLRDVEDILAYRGVEVSHKTIHKCEQRFGPLFADVIRAGNLVPALAGENMFLVLRFFFSLCAATSRYRFQEIATPVPDFTVSWMFGLTSSDTSTAIVFLPPSIGHLAVRRAWKRRRRRSLEAGSSCCRNCHAAGIGRSRWSLSTTQRRHSVR